MSTIVVEQPRQSGMATPSSPSVQPQAAAPAEANGTKKPADEAAAESMDVDMDKREEEKKPKEAPVAVANRKATVETTCNAESASDTSRKLVERAKRRLQIQMQFVENARRKILDETHPDMQERLQVLAQERDRLLRVAKQRSEHFQHGTTVIFDYESEEANSEYELHCEKLRQDMLEEIHHEMEILHDQRKGGHIYARATTRKTRSARNKNGSDSGFALDTAQKIKKRAGYVFQPLENALGQSEIDHDVRELSSVYEATKKRRMEFDTDGEAPIVAKYYRNKFLYRDWIFQEGDEVYVLNYPASSEYAAVICGITSTELLVLSEKGKYYRLVIMDIRQGRVVLTTLSSEQAVSRDDLGDASP